MKVPANVNDLKEIPAKKLLKKIIKKLDELDCEDFFGTEGWKHMFGLED